MLDKKTIVHPGGNERLQYVDLVDSSPQGKEFLLENRDYAGAHAKSDPAEIALVKKLDWRIMVYITLPFRSLRVVY